MAVFWFNRKQIILFPIVFSMSHDNRLRMRRQACRWQSHSFNDIVDVNVRWLLSRMTPMIFNLMIANDSVDIIVSTSSKTINIAIASTLQLALSAWLGLMPIVPHAPTNAYMNTISTIFRCHIDIANSMRKYAILRRNKTVWNMRMDFIVFRTRNDSVVQFNNKYWQHLKKWKLCKKKRKYLQPRI